MHGQFSSFLSLATMPPAAQQWDPYTVLGIAKARTRCCGWAPSKNRDCHNTVAEANRLKAQQLLGRLSILSPWSDDVVSDLNEIAHYLLCRNPGCRHQDQARSVERKWREKIRAFVRSAFEPRDEDTETDEAAGGEHTFDIQEQMAECQRLLMRVATALETHQEAQRRFETFSVGSDNSTDTIRAQSTVESETPRSENARDDVEVERTAEPLATGLNLDDVQTLVRRLALEHEANRLRRSRTVRFEEDESRQSVVASATSSTASSQTILSGNPHPGLQVSEHNQRVEEHSESPAILPEAEGPNDASRGHSSSETTTPMTTGLTGTENDQPGNDNDCDQGCRQCQSHSSRRYANPMLLAAVALYLGVLFVWYRFQVLETSGPRQLTLDGPLTHQIGGMAGQTDVGGPLLSSIAITRY